eukprot:423812-Hanusia_phi.AAC.3
MGEDNQEGGDKGRCPVPLPALRSGPVCPPLLLDHIEDRSGGTVGRVLLPAGEEVLLRLPPVCMGSSVLPQIELHCPPPLLPEPVGGRGGEVLEELAGCHLWICGRSGQEESREGRGQDQDEEDEEEYEYEL